MRFKLWILSAMTILAMGLFCVPAAADTSGRCGEDVTWVLDPDTGVLTISGTGEMYWGSYYQGSAFGFREDILSVVIEDGVTSIGGYAFRECSNLMSVTIPDSVTSFGEGVFYDCTSLVDVTIPESMTFISRATFSGCSSLTDIEIPDSVAEIGYDAFYGCSSLTNVTIPESVIYIDSYACDVLPPLALR